MPFDDADDRALFRLTLANAAVLAIGGHGLLRGLTNAAFWFGRLALLADVIALALLCALPALAASRIRGGRFASRALAPALFALALIALFVDRRVLAIFGSTLSGEMLVQARPLQPREWMGLGTGEVLAFFAICAAIVLAEILAHAALLRARNSARGAGIRWRGLAIASTTLLGATVALYRARGEPWRLESAAERLPLFASIRPATHDVPALALDPEVARRFALLSGPGHLLLPRNPIHGHEPAAPLNIVVLVLDSWRADAFGEELTPALAEFSREAIRCTHHFSGGNQTTTGMFTLLYGMHLPSSRLVTDEGLEPLLLARTTELGYRTLVQVGTNLDWNPVRELRRLAPSDVRFRYPGETVDRQDRAMIDDFVRFLDTRDPEQPFFDLLFISSTHAGYAFDETRARFRPWSGEIGYLTANLDDDAKIRAVKNRYWNSVAYADELAGKVLAEIASHDLSRNTIVVVTGDHGEAFKEHSSWGHGRNLHWQSTQVPMLIRVPGETPRVVERLTSHIDLVATLLPLLGVENPEPDYSAGRSLLAPDGPDHVLSCTEQSCARRDALGTTFFQLSVERPAIATFDASDQRVEPIDAEAARRVVDSFDELARFVE